ncbi:O-acetylhomoserine aminocarboxypropyltransferase/cysteine synthase [Sneathiella marina]|uniref:O-acetylhomoserine aminocarboxypropyltransferase/cysteine synthase n=1 Tax=Sneathiella marina TaxID=2950108 RepID=A0ABY4W4V1_9PROT|nr:O-acetylhomoserine aminocarboxypropyltransferase/cysteine synthase family protein [Sneathiella marina]USG62217.1 O-acetylhomoserine aminocarboxypropyltransferase/cysteine synthase [Sneathiella marina]
MTKSSFLGPDTIALHSGYQPEAEHGARAVPIYQTTSYVFDSVDEGSALFNLEKGGHIYSRLTNPTVATLEQRLAALEGGVGAVCTASGMSAIFATVISLCSAGDHIVCASQIYGSSVTLFQNTFKRFGIECTFVSINDKEALAAAIQDNTKMVFCESIGNPGLEVSNLPMISEVAHASGIPLVVDATFATPALCHPLEHGADVVIHSVTKWIGGHGLAIGGVVIDGGSFDWKASGRFPTMTEPFEPYHGIRFWDEFGPSALSMRIRVETMLNIGPSMSPNSAFLFLQGLETLSLRMKQHVANAQALSQWLANHEDVAWVNHPDLDGSPTYDLAKQLFPEGAGSMLCFGLKGGRDAGAKFIENVKISSHLANVGDARTLVLHPASTTHSRLDDEAMRAGGLSPDMIRVSVGIETFKDIKADFASSIKAAAKAVAKAGN